MNVINDGGPAFPVDEWRHEDQEFVLSGGISVRDYFAAKAMQGMLANQHPYQASDEHMFARDSYQLADAMIRAREVTA